MSYGHSARGRLRTCDLRCVRPALLLLSYTSETCPRRGSNPRPSPYKSAAHTNWASRADGSGARARTGNLALNRGLLSHIELLRTGSADGTRTRNVSCVKGRRLSHSSTAPWCPELGSNQRHPPCRGGALPLSYRDGSGTGIRTRDVWIMSPARYLSAPSRSAAEGNRTQSSVLIKSQVPGHQAPAACWSPAGERGASPGSRTRHRGLRRPGSASGARDALCLRGIATSRPTA